MIKILSMTLSTLNYGNYGIFLIMGNAGLIPSTVGFRPSLFFQSRGLHRNQSLWVGRL